MNQLKFYKLASLVLLLLNIAMIAFFFLTAPPPQLGPPNGKQNAKDIMNMDDRQHESFLKLVEQHKQQMENYNQQQGYLLKPYFNTLIEKNNNNSADSIIDQLLNVEKHKIESTYEHFEKIKSLLKPEQQSNFEPFMSQAIQDILLQSEK